jgi:hypothetical protein
MGFQHPIRRHMNMRSFAGQPLLGFDDFWTTYAFSHLLGLDIPGQRQQSRTSVSQVV